VAILASQPSVGTAASLIASVPAGPSTVIISNVSGGTVWVGGAAVTSSDGFPIPTGSPPVVIPGYVTSAATRLSAVAGSAVTVGVIISTDD
jgi:hypothetical protein